MMLFYLFTIIHHLHFKLSKTLMFCISISSISSAEQRRGVARAVCICEPLANVNLFLYGAPAYARQCLLCSTLSFGTCFLYVFSCITGVYHGSISWAYVGGLQAHCLCNLALYWLCGIVPTLSAFCMPTFETKKPLPFVRSGAEGMRAQYRGIAGKWANIRLYCKKPARINGRAFQLLGWLANFKHWRYLIEPPIHLFTF